MRRLRTIALAAVLLAATLQTSSAQEPAGTCNGLTATINGSSGDDTITGTSSPDVIYGGTGSDYIEGLGGGDTICGGPGPDDLYGNQGDDTMRGGDDNDSLEGNGGNDVISTGDSGASNPNWPDVQAGNIATGDWCSNEISAGRPCYEGNDTIYGGPGNTDRLTGDKGNDYLDGGLGSDDQDYGGDGVDTCFAEYRTGCERP